MKHTTKRVTISDWFDVHWINHLIVVENVWIDILQLARQNSANITCEHIICLLTWVFLSTIVLISLINTSHHHSVFSNISC